MQCKKNYRTDNLTTVSVCLVDMKAKIAVIFPKKKEKKQIPAN